MPSSFFPSASEARSMSRDNLFIFREIRDIEEQILIAQGNEAFEVTVDSTGMTTVSGDDWIHNHLLPGDTLAEEYYKVWKMVETDPVKTEQMNIVIKYFKDLSYSIVRQTNPSTLDTFVWVVKW